MTRSSHFCWFHHPNMWWAVRIMTLLITQYLVCHYLFPLRPKYLRHHPILEHSQPIFLPLMWETKFHTHTKQQAKLQFCIFWCVWPSVASGKTEVSGTNGSRHSGSLICSLFLHTYKPELSLYSFSQSELQTLRLYGLSAVPAVSRANGVWTT